MTQSAWTPADQEGCFRLTPVERLGQPEDIAHAVWFLYLLQSELYYESGSRGRWRVFHCRYPVEVGRESTG